MEALAGVLKPCGCAGMEALAGNNNYFKKYKIG
jgi:hypothetical protein